MLQITPTFADRVKGTSKSNLKRPTCLNFRTKTNLKGHEVIELLKEINFEPQKLEGVAEMKSRSIDITSPMKFKRPVLNCLFSLSGSATTSQTHCCSICLSQACTTQKRLGPH